MMLTPEQEAIRAMTRAFVAQEIAPHAVGWDRDRVIPLPTVRARCACRARG